MKRKVCTRCKTPRPCTVKYFYRVTKTRLRNQCKSCINKARRDTYCMNKASIYKQNDHYIKHILKIKSNDKDLIETKKLQLFLKNKVQYSNIQLLTDEGMVCLRCKTKQPINLPIDILYLEELFKIFKSNHTHD